MVHDALGIFQLIRESTKPFVPWLITATLMLVLLIQPNQADYTRWGLPDGTAARIGKGLFTDMQLSPDGSRLAIASSAGVWLYDVSTGAEIGLITENTALIGVVALSPDGTRLATASGDKKCRIWDVNSQKLLSTFKTPDWLHALRFLVDGKTLVGEGLIDKISKPLFGGDPQIWNVPKVWMWDVQTGKRLGSFTTELPKFNPLKDVRTSVQVTAFADSSRVTFAFENRDGTISVKDGRTHSEITTLPQLNGEVSAFSFSPDGKKLAVIASSREGQLWDIDTSKPVLTFSKRIENYHEKPSILAFSKDGKILANGGLDDIEIWNIETQSHMATLKRQNSGWGVWEFVLSADGRTVITMGKHGTVDVWSATTSEHQRTLTTGYTDRFATLAFTHDGKTIATSAGNKVQLWHTNTGTEKLRMQLPGDQRENTKMKISAIPLEQSNGVISLAFSEYATPLAISTHSTTLAAFTVSGKVEIWDVDTEKYSTDYDLTDILLGAPSEPLKSGLTTVPMPRTPAVYHFLSTSYDRSGQTFSHAAAFSPDGEKLVIQTQHNVNVMEIWDVLTRRRLCTLPDRTPNRNRALAFTLAFRADSEVLAIGDGSDVHLANTETGETFATFSPPKQKSIIDKLQGLFNAQGSELSVDAVALSHADTLEVVAASAGKTIYVWNIAKHEPILTLKGHTSEVCQLAFAPDDTILASGDADGTIHCWLLPAGRKLATFKPYVSPVRQLVFSPDGKTLASTNLYSQFSGTILLWDVPPQ